MTAAAPGGQVRVVDLSFTPAEEAFRTELRAWLREHVPGAAPAALRTKKRKLLLNTSRQYCSPPPPVPLHMMAAPLLCVRVPLTQAVSVNLNEESNVTLGESGTETS